MLKPSWWLLAAGIAHPCSAVAGFVLGAGAADKAYKLYNKRLIINEENASLKRETAKEEEKWQPRLDQATARRDHLKAQLARLRIEPKKT